MAAAPKPKTAPGNRSSKEVDAWFSRYENTKKDVVLRIREIVLAADPRVDESIKWQAPTFPYTGQTSRVLKIATVAEANKAKADIEKIVRAWCDWRSKKA